MIVHTEFRDGNVGAGYQQKRVLEESLDQLPDGVERVRLRSDSAGYQHELVRFCEENQDRFGRIEFTISSDVTPEFKKAVAEVKQEEWQSLIRVRRANKRRPDESGPKYVLSGSTGKTSGAARAKRLIR